jgi:hypothetical protein
MNQKTLEEISQRMAGIDIAENGQIANRPKQ